MKTLEEEIKDHFASNHGLYTPYSVKDPSGKFTDVVAQSKIAEFIQSSKWVQAERIKAQIDYITNEMYAINYDIRKIYIEELEQQLKKLEDESR